MISLEPSEKQIALQEHFRRLAVKRLRPRSILIDAANRPVLIRIIGL